MRHLRKGAAALAVLSLALFAVACNKGPAEAALKSAEQALETARPELERYVPEQVSSLTASAQEARAQLDKGNYTEALKAAQELPTKVEAAVVAANAKKVQLVASWNEMSGSLPGILQSITDKVTALAAAKALPMGMTPPMLALAQAELAAANLAWTEASRAFQGGDVPRAVTTAMDVKAKAESIAAMVGLAAAPASDSASAAPHD